MSDETSSNPSADPGDDVVGAVRPGFEPERRDAADLEALISHCNAALAIAEARRDRFLSYMLQMTLMAARQHLPPGPPSGDEQVAEAVRLGS